MPPPQKKTSFFLKAGDEKSTYVETPCENYWGQTNVYCEANE